MHTRRKDHTLGGVKSGIQLLAFSSKEYTYIIGNNWKAFYYKELE